MTRMLTAFLFAACAYAAFVQPASAEDWKAKSTTVSYLGLDLTRESGAEIVFRRLVNASRRVCGNAYQRRTSLIERVIFNRCADETLGQAVASLDAPLVRRLYATRRPVIIVASR